MDIPEQLKAALIAAIEKTFTPFLGNIPLIRPAGASPLLGAEWVGVLKFSGPCNGTLLAVFSNSGACQFAACRLKREITTVDEVVFTEIRDCLTQLLGLLKASFPKGGESVILATPVVESAKDFSEQRPGEAADAQLDVVAGDWKMGVVLRYTLPFETNDQTSAESPPQRGESAKFPGAEQPSPAGHQEETRSHVPGPENHLDKQSEASEPVSLGIPSVRPQAPGGMSNFIITKEGQDVTLTLKQEPDAVNPPLAAIENKPLPAAGSAPCPEDIVGTQAKERVSQKENSGSLTDSEPVISQAERTPLWNGEVKGDISSPLLCSDEGLGELYSEAMRKLDVLLAELKKKPDGEDKQREEGCQ